MRDWCRETRRTALGGLLDGTLMFGWGRAATGADDSVSEIELVICEGDADDAL
jgi:hypothetical protein